MPHIEELIIIPSEMRVRGSLAHKLRENGIPVLCIFISIKNSSLKSLQSLVQSLVFSSKMKTGTDKPSRLQSRFFTGHYTMAEINSICKSGMGSSRIDQPTATITLSTHRQFVIACNFSQLTQ